MLGNRTFLRAIDNILGDSWFSKDKCENNDYWMKNHKNNISIKIDFTDESMAEINFNDGGWSNYKDKNRGNKNGMTLQKVILNQDIFPCTYLSANRDLAKNMQFRSYELMGKVKAFNDKIEEQTKTKPKIKNLMK